MRFLVEIVERFDFCPFARGARKSNAIARRVLLDASVEEAIAATEALAGQPTVEIGLLIFPRLAIGPEPFDRFVQRVRDADQTRAFAMAAFHPDAPYSTENPARLVMLLRRTPDPTIQLVRFSVLQAVKGKDPPSGKVLMQWNAKTLADLMSRREAQPRPLSERIADANFATVAREGAARIEALLAEIRADRDASYARSL